MLRKYLDRRGKLKGGWRKLHNRELYKSYCSLNIIRVIKSRMKWMMHFACTGEMRNAFQYTILVANLSVKDRLEESSIIGRILLEGILK
jgi:hypothetical protein